MIIVLTAVARWRGEDSMSNIEHLIENGLHALSNGDNFDEIMNQFPNNDMLESVNMTKDELRQAVYYVFYTVLEGKYSEEFDTE